MKIEIKNRWNGLIIFSIEAKSLKVALEIAVDKCANLRGANLTGAYLRDAQGINKYRCTPLWILKEQIGNIRAYKLVNKDSEGPFNGGIVYKMGKTAKVDDIDEDESKQCAAGINLATLDWCMREWREDYRILIVEFPRWIEKDDEKIDNLVIPIATDGKFRVRECTIVGEKDLVEIGLIKQETAKAKKQWR